MEIIGNLVRNAFFDAILPGLERERARLTGGRIGPDPNPGPGDDDDDDDDEARRDDGRKAAESKRDKDDRNSDTNGSDAGRGGEKSEAKR